MKRKPSFFLPVLLTGLSLTCYLFTEKLNRQKSAAHTQPATTDVLFTSTKPVTEPVANSIRSFLEKQEYTIKVTDGAYRSPNRKQNTRVVYDDDGFEIVPRKEEGQNWRLALALAGISKGGKDLSASVTPDYILDRNTLQVVHDDYTLEYINDENGTRQNFLITKKPEGKEDLKILLQTSGTISLQSVMAGRAAFGDAGGTKLYYQDLNVWDARGRNLPARMENENEALAIVVDDREAVYPVTVDPLATTPGKVLESQQADDQMGYSIAAAGDINNDGFGDLLVGAITYDNGQTDEGAAFIYYGSAAGLAAAPNVILESNSANLRFGYSLAAADFNNDGFSDVVIGAPQYTNGVGEAFEGAVYIYYGSAAGPVLTPTILEGNRGGARMGTSVAAGDLNGDGRADIASGALGYNNAGALYNGQGGVYVFYGIEGGFAGSPVILTTGLMGGVTFGGTTTGVSIGNFNGDSYKDLVVGASGYDEGTTNQGAVFLYLGSATGVPPVHSRVFTGSQANARLGSSVAFAGDLNKDGYEDIAAGAPYYSQSQTREGAVFIYYGSATSPVTTQIIGSTIADAYMGYTVAGGGDLDGDGFDDLAVGAYNYQFDPDALRGGVFVFGGSLTGVQSAPILSKQENNTNLNGFSIAYAKNINGAKGVDLAVGMPGYTGGEEANGSVAIYSGEPGTLPVTLTHFTAKRLPEGAVEITWNTHSEQRNSHFEVLRSSDGNRFTLLGRRQGQLNSNSPTTYRLTDESPQQGSNFYKLVQYDVDGKSKQLGIRLIRVSLATARVAVFPNPTPGLLTLIASGEGYKKAELVDIAGRVFRTQKIQPGETLHFDLSGLAKGVYLVRFHGIDGTIISKRVVKN